MWIAMTASILIGLIFSLPFASAAPDSKADFSGPAKNIPANNSATPLLRLWLLPLPVPQLMTDTSSLSGINATSLTPAELSRIEDYLAQCSLAFDQQIYGNNSSAAALSNLALLCYKSHLHDYNWALTRAQQSAVILHELQPQEKLKIGLPMMEIAVSLAKSKQTELATILADAVQKEIPADSSHIPPPLNKQFGLYTEAMRLQQEDANTKSTSDKEHTPEVKAPSSETTESKREKLNPYDGGKSRSKTSSVSKHQSHSQVVLIPASECLTAPVPVAVQRAAAPVPRAAMTVRRGPDSIISAGSSTRELVLHIHGVPDFSKQIYLSKCQVSYDEQVYGKRSGLAAMSNLALASRCSFNGDLDLESASVNKVIAALPFLSKEAKKTITLTMLPLADILISLNHNQQATVVADAVLKEMPIDTSNAEEYGKQFSQLAETSRTRDDLPMAEKYEKEAISLLEKGLARGAARIKQERSKLKEILVLKAKE